jgi:hypothetical protein
MFARQVADLAASHGRTGLADEMMQRFDEMDNHGTRRKAMMVERMAAVE